MIQRKDITIEISELYKIKENAMLDAYVAAVKHAIDNNTKILVTNYHAESCYIFIKSVDIDNGTIEISIDANYGFLFNKPNALAVRLKFVDNAVEIGDAFVTKYGVEVGYDSRYYRGLKSYILDREEFIKAFDEVFTNSEIYTIEDFCGYDKCNYDDFILNRYNDEYYIIHAPSGRMISWYKHLGRSNSSNIRNMTYSDLVEFLTVLKSCLNDSDEDEWEQCNHSRIKKPQIKKVYKLIPKDTSEENMNMIYSNLAKLASINTKSVYIIKDSKYGAIAVTVYDDISDADETVLITDLRMISELYKCTLETE